MFKVGKVLNYFEKIGSALVLIDNPISIGDTVKFVRGQADLFEQKVSSLKVNHEDIQTIKKGQIVNIKTEQKVEKDDEIYKI
ncbi:U32 family peptidase C-terminal domain-containing protein [Candidatus Microgenomates bacterium]|nr:U32 family peptidase C-terminal domain-containing protein [Candidatus Microgenomates bacterium]